MLLLSSLLAAPLSAQQRTQASAKRVTYAISFPNAAHHEAEVTVTFTGAAPGRPLEVRMSRSSPGRYALHEFAKNVYRVRAFDGAGRELSIVRPNEHQWNVSGHNGTVRFAYTLFADHADGTYSGIDLTHAHLQMPATFAYARGFDTAPIEVTFNLPDPTWKIATQLFPTNSPNVFRAPDMQYFFDSPVEISNHAVREWTEKENGRDVRIRMIVHHQGTEAQVDSFQTLVRRIVEEERAVFGEYPRYDVGYYTFLNDYVPWVFGDGMEHRNSTTITGTRPLTGAGIRQNTSTVAHEYFHSWSMERIRSRALEPFDFEKANMSGELWFGEGFTSYYDALIRARAGIFTLDEYATDTGNNLSFVLNSPGRHVFSAAEMSMQAPFVDAAVSIDATNRGNTFISYYNYGKAIGLALDLTLRTRFDKTLDDYMRAMWLKHGKPEIPYTMDDLRTVLGSVTGDKTFADDFFRRFITGLEAPAYEQLLASAGLLLRPRSTDPVFTYARIGADNAGAVRVLSATLREDPFYLAGIDAGDRLVRIGSRTISSADDVQAALREARAGVPLEVTFEQRGTTRTAQVTPQASNALEVVTYESAGRPVTDAIRAFRSAWLGPKTSQ